MGFLIFQKQFLVGLIFKGLHTGAHYEPSIKEIYRSCHFS